MQAGRRHFMGTAPRIAGRGIAPSKLSFGQLDAAFDERAATVKRDFIALIPFLRDPQRAPPC